MKTARRILRPAAGLSALVLMLTAIFPTQAHAYIDPVSGSIILQVIAAGALAAAFTFKRLTHRVRQTARSIWARVWTS